MILLESTQFTDIFVLLITGAAVGFTCGLLGIGGGFIMVPIPIRALTSAGIDPTLDTRTDV